MNSKKALIGVAAVLAIIYFSLFSMATNGYGYMGYHGYNSGPSFWYWGGTRSYYDRSFRSNRLNASSTRGGGPGSGK